MFFTPLLLCFFATPFLSAISAQQLTRAKVISTETSVKPLNAKTLKLNRKASGVLKRWKEAKHMEITKTGNFVPMKNPASNTGGNLPGGHPTSFADGTNCAKIECPDVFDDSVTCWECH